MTRCDDEIESRFDLVPTGAENGNPQTRRTLRPEYGVGWGGQD